SAPFSPPKDTFVPPPIIRTRPPDYLVAGGRGILEFFVATPFPEGNLNGSTGSSPHRQRTVTPSSESAKTASTRSLGGGQCCSSPADAFSAVCRSSASRCARGSRAATSSGGVRDVNKES